jgi:hypothetical protein
MWVGVFTLMLVPARGSLVIVRSGNVTRADAVTLLTGPARVVSAAK